MKQYLMPVPPNGFPVWPAWLTELLNLMDARLSDSAGMAEFGKSLTNRDGDEAHIVSCEVCGSLAWLEAGARTIFPEPEVYEACRRSDALETVCGNDIRWPYPVFAFYYPKNDLPDPKPIATVFIVRPEAGVWNFKRHGRSIQLVTDNPKAVVLSFWTSPDGDVQSCGLRVGTVLINDKPLAENIDKARTRTLSRSEQKAWGLNQDDANAMYAMIGTCMSMILLMQSYPEYVTDFRTTQRMAGRTREMPHRSISLPSRLRQQIRVGMDHQPGDGSRGRVAHWRRGHWRRQPHGNRWAMEHPNVEPIIDHKGRTCHMDWILPIFIAGGQVAEATA